LPHEQARDSDHENGPDAAAAADQKDDTMVSVCALHTHPLTPQHILHSATSIVEEGDHQRMLCVDVETYSEGRHAEIFAVSSNQVSDMTSEHV
jgi:hypothetical protein